MSLVNQVLRDLQARRVDLGGELTDLEPADWRTGRRLARRLALPVLALMLAVPAYAAWQWKSAHVQRTEARYELQALVLPARDEPASISSDLVTPPIAPTGEQPAERISEVATAMPPVEPVLAPEPEPEGSPPQRAPEPEATRASDAPTPSRLVKRAVADPRTQAARALQGGLAAQGRGDLQAAERHFRAAVTAYPRDAIAWSHLHAVLLRQGQTQAAAAAATEGLRKASDPASLAVRHARALIAGGDLAAALDVLRAHRPDHRRPDYEALLAWLLQRNEHHREAVHVYRDLVAGSPATGEWWVGLAISLESLGRRSEALQAFERAHASDTLASPLAAYATQRIAALEPKEGK